MNYTFYEVIMLFFTYSFLAWMAETTVATIKVKDFRNRGFASGPFCFVYGFTAVVLTIFLKELRNNIFFLFLGSMAVATAVEWFTGKILEGIKQKKWWDYSGKRFNFDGYICLQYSVIWGILGLITVRYGNGLILGLFHILPQIVQKVVVFSLIIVGFIDFSGSLMSVLHLEDKLTTLLRWNRKLQKWTFQFAAKVTSHIENRIYRSYPSVVKGKTGEIEKNNEKCSFIQLFWLFIIGAFLGDVVETIFCRINMGVWMSRSSLVWGPFSVVWGLAITLVTALLYRDRDKQEHYIFCVGFFLGGAYEYICSVFTEILFGTVFWDYSAMSFNLGGRINLLYCCFWGIAAVIWIKFLYPKVLKLIDSILSKTAKVLTWIFIVFLAMDIFVSMLALIRYDSRTDGKEAVYPWEQVMDNYFNDDRMEKIYPNAKKQ